MWHSAIPSNMPLNFGEAIPDLRFVCPYVRYAKPLTDRPTFIENRALNDPRVLKSADRLIRFL